MPGRLPLGILNDLGMRRGEFDVLVALRHARKYHVAYRAVRDT